MIQAGVSGAAKEMLLGHSIGLDDKYYRPTPEDLLEEYLKAVDSLTINDEHRLRRKVEELTTKTSDEALKQRVEKMSKTLAVLEKWALHNEQGEHDMYRDELEDLFEKS